MDQHGRWWTGNRAMSESQAYPKTFGRAATRLHLCCSFQNVNAVRPQVFVLLLFQVALLLAKLHREPLGFVIPTLVYSVPRIAMQLVAEDRIFGRMLQSMHDRCNIMNEFMGFFAFCH